MAMGVRDDVVIVGVLIMALGIVLHQVATKTALNAGGEGSEAAELLVTP